MPAKVKVGLVQPGFQQTPFTKKIYFLPYSVGMLWSYINSFEHLRDKFELDAFIFKRDLLTDAAHTLKNCNIVGFSTYIWNKNYNYRLAEILKAQNPEILIVFGGPEVPLNDDTFLNKHPYIDIIVKNEGEISFKSILENYDQKQWKSISGLLFNDNGKTVDTGPSERITNLDQIPSPYLSGIFDKLISDHPDIEWNAPVETNRGCPYACTFCDWGGLTHSKVKKFGLERVFAEFEWMGQNRVGYSGVADANFGIYPERDLLIAEKFVEVQKKYGYPYKFIASWAKNQRTSVINIIKALKESPLLPSGPGFGIAVQTLTDEVLVNVKRKNLEINDIEKILQECARENITTFTELIIGLPGETLESWKNTYERLFNAGFHSGIYVYQAQVLENSEMNIQQKDIFKIKTVNLPNYYIGSTLPDVSECIEYTPVVCETKDLPFNDMINAELYSWLMHTLHSSGLTQLVARFLKKYINLSFKDFYNDLLLFLLEDNWWRSQFNIMKKYYEQSLKGVDVVLEEKSGIVLDNAHASYNTILNLNSDGKHQHLFKLLDVFLLKYRIDPTLINDLMQLQKTYVVEYQHINHYPMTLKLSYNVYDYITSSVDLVQTETKYQLSYVGNITKENTLTDYIYELVYYGTKTQPWLARITHK